MQTIERPEPAGLRTAVERELARARCGRIYATCVRSEVTTLERESARVARASGMSVAEIAADLGLSIQRIYQLLKDST